MNDRKTEMQLSVVIPVYNEEDNLGELSDRLFAAIAPLSQPFELIFIDDGSSDQSAEVIRQLGIQHSEIRLLQFEQNSGQTSALDAGFRAARGEQVVMIDSDLQNDPADIPLLLKHLQDHDMVAGKRVKRNDPWIRLVSTRIANGIRNWVSGEDITDSACGLKAFRREVIERLKLYDGLHRFLPTLARIEGFSVIEVPVSHHPRKKGKAKYNIRNRAFRALIDLFAVTWMKKRHLKYRIIEENQQ